MSDQTVTPSSHLTRREAIKRGAALGGALVWAVPVVQTVGMRAAYAQTTSPVPGDYKDISYIGLNVSCSDGAVTSTYSIKYEGCVGDDCFESDPGNFPKCSGVFTATGTKADGDTLGFTAKGPSANGVVSIKVPIGCMVTSSAIKGGQCCNAGPTGTGTLFFNPPAPC